MIFRAAGAIVLPLNLFLASSSLSAVEEGARINPFKFDTREWALEEMRRCTRSRVEDGIPTTWSIPDRKCYRFQPERRFTGIFVDEFEGQQFIEGIGLKPPYDGRGGHIWLQFDEHSKGLNLIRRGEGSTKIWLIEFDGRRNRDPGYFGHLGASNGLILVDQVRSAKLLHEVGGYVGPDLLTRAEF